MPARQDVPEESESDRVLLLKEAFQLLWALAMHSPLPLRDMTQGAGMFNTLVRAASYVFFFLRTDLFAYIVFDSI